MAWIPQRTTSPPPVVETVRVESSGRQQATWPVAIGLLLGVYAAGVGAVHFAPADSDVATWWPAAGIAVSAVALTPRRWWPAIVAGVAISSAAANFTGGRDLEISTLFGLANAAEALVAGYFLTRLTGSIPSLNSQGDFVRLAQAALLGGVVIATGAALTVMAVDDGSFWVTWRSVVASHSASTLILVPIAMTWWQRHRVDRPIELALQSLALLAVTLAVFAPDRPSTLAFVPIPFLVWGALRFDVRTVAWQLVGFSLLNTALTVRGHGPFGHVAELDDTGIFTTGSLSQLYLLCAAILSLPVAIAVRHGVVLMERVTADEVLFRRNFTESLVGMLLMRTDGNRLVINAINDTGVTILSDDDPDLVGCYLDEILDADGALPHVVHRMLSGHQDGWSSQVGLVDRPGRRVNVALSLLSGDREDPIFSAQILDVTAEYDAHRRIEAAEKLTNATLNTTACIILVTDLDGTIVRINSATTDITGYGEAELVGRPVWETSIAPSDASDIEALFMWPNRSGLPVLDERDATTKGGEKLRVVWNNNIVRDEHGFPAYAVMTGIDVTSERTAAGLMNHLMQASFTTALVGVDTAGRVTVFNSGAQHLLGYEPQEIVGQPFHRLLDPEELLERTGAETVAEAFGVLVESLGEDGETRARDWTWVSSSGHHHIVSMTLSVAQDAFASQVGFLIVGREVTEQRQGQEMLVAALDKERMVVERLRALDEAKNEFVSTVSHELRTPITSIVGYTEMLQDGTVVEPDADQLPMLDIIARNGRRLIVICNDLLLLSGLDSGTLQWQRDTFDLADTLGPVEDSIRPLLSGRTLDLIIEGSDSPVIVTGDRVQIERVLINLLSNAVKFTEDGGQVSCRLSREGSEGVLTVRDTGIGIPVEEQPELFQKFFRSSSAQERAIQGTGLGLSIVAAIVAAHGGRISVDSAHLAGTTFTVRLPLARG